MRTAGASSSGLPQSADGPMRLGVRLASLALIAWGVASTGHLGVSGRGLVELVVLVVCGGAWVGWVLGRQRESLPLTLASLVVMAAAGGVLASLVAIADVFLGVAAMGAALALDLGPAVGLAAVGPVVLLVASALAGRPLELAAGGAAAALAGIVGGTARRESLERAAQAAVLALERERSEVERSRAEVLAERNHLAREIHDVLAHSLGAVVVQLEALGSIAGTADAATIHEGLRRVRRLVTEGLEESRRAVGALRDDAPPLADQLTRVCEEAGAAFDGPAQLPRLEPGVSLAAYRIVQESLT
ncbi:MAG TPA: histidine kinase, partial [Acidimicrobiales bacterium]|nr:histidine kinase [Acidimicrobiales bacterium]